MIKSARQSHGRLLVINSKLQHQKKTPISKQSAAPKRSVPEPHQRSSKKKTHSAQFCQLIAEQYDDATSAFYSHQGQEGLLGRKAFKGLVASLGMDIADADRKQLRKRISSSTSNKTIDLESFLAFVASILPESGTASYKTRATDDKSKGHLVALPIEVSTTKPQSNLNPDSDSRSQSCPQLSEHAVTRRSSCCEHF
jgi:hypothetical protein